MYKWLALYLLLIFPKPLYAQLIKQNTQIKSANDFDKSYEKITEILMGDRSDTSYNSALFSSTQNMQSWAERANDSFRVLKAKVILLYYYSNQENDLEIIRRGNDLLSVNYFNKLPESYYAIATLIRAYERNEQFNTVIDLMPRYFELGEKWQDKDFKKQNIGRKLGNVYYRMGDFNTAKKHYLDQLTNSHNQKILSASVSNDIALCCAKLKDYKQANRYFNIALHIIDSVISSGFTKEFTIPYLRHFRNVIYANLLTELKPSGERNLIITALLKQLQTAKIEMERNIILSSYYHLALIYYEAKNYNQSLSYADSALLELKTYYNPTIYMDVLQLKGRILANIGRVEESDLVFNHLTTYGDSLNRTRSSRNREIAAIQFEINEKENQLNQSQFEIKQKKQLSKIQQIAIILISILLATTLIFLYYFYRARQKVQNQLQTINIILKEKDVLLKEVHHRIKNNLQVVTGLLEIQAAKENNDAFDKLVTESGRSINAIALVHQQLYQNSNVGVVNMDIYIKKLCTHTMEIMANNNISINCNLEQIDLKIEQSVPIGLILNELLSNTYKHAYQNSQGIIDISLTSHEEWCNLSYQDYGKGINLENHKTKKESIGFSLIDMLAEELEASVTKENVNGLKYTFTFYKTGQNSSLSSD